MMTSLSTPFFSSAGIYKLCPKDMYRCPKVMYRCPNMMYRCPNVMYRCPNIIFCKKLMAGKKNSKYPLNCEHCNLHLQNSSIAYSHKIKYHSSSDNMASKTSNNSLTSKREYSTEVNALVDKGVEALLAGGDRKRIITRWQSNTEMHLDSEKLLAVTIRKEKEFLQDYGEDAAKLEAKYKNVSFSAGSREYLNFLGNLPRNDDNYDKLLNEELKFLEYAASLVKFGNNNFYL
jgi:hypothetical protein